MSSNGPADEGNEISEQSVVTVVALERYMTDPVFTQQTGLTGHRANDAYDLTVADGRHRRKIVLSPAFNRHIQKRMVHIGSTVRLKKVRMRYDESSLSGRGIPILEDLEVVGETDQDAAVLSRLPWHSQDSNQQECSQPLASSRAYYVDLWSTADVVTTTDSVDVQVKTSLEEVTSSDLYSLREVARNWRSLKQSKPPLLLRVMRRPRLVHYARPEKSDKWPFQLPLVVGDRTGCCVAVFWNIMAPRYLPHVQEGTVMLVRNFTIKPRFQMPEHQVWHPAGLPWFDIDININAHHPQAEVTLLDPSVLEDLHDVDLPLPATNFIMRRQLSFLPDNFVCDVVGLITFVGAVQREKMKVKQGTDSGGFWIKRWVFIQDHTSQRPIVLQLYRGAQQVEFEDKIAPGRVLVCRHMRVVHSLNQLQSSRQPLHVYLSSTRDTQIYTCEKEDDADFPFARSTVLQSVLDWADTATCQIPKTGKLTEIFFSYPPQPNSLEAFSSLHENMEIMPSDGWTSFIENLSYREATQMIVQAHLVSVSFHRKTVSSTSRRTRRRQRGSRRQVKQVALESRDPAEWDAFDHLGYVDVDKQATAATGHRLYTGNHNKPNLDPTFAGQDYMCLRWRGLNANTILDTVKILNLTSCPAGLTFQSLVAGSHDAAPGETGIRVGDDSVRRLLASAKVKGPPSSSRYLVMLDVYCVDGQTVLLNVNRAFPIR